MAITAGLGYLIGAGISAAGNIGMTAYQNQKQEQFYNGYMSPLARMAQMYAAGINPNAAAQGISGASAPMMNAASPSNAFNGVGELVSQAALADATKENIQADTENKKSQTQGQDIQNQFDAATFEDRVTYLKNQGLISEEEYKQASELSRQYPEMLNQSIEQIKSNIRKNDAQVKVFDQQITNLKKEIDKMEEEIKKMKSDESVNYAMVGEIGARKELEEAEKILTEKKQQLADVEKNKAELGADSNVELKYREIEKKSGTKAADDWLDSQYKVVNKIEQGVQDANVMTQEQRRIIDSYDKEIAKAEKWLKECSDKYYNAGSVRKSWFKGNMEAAQNKLDNLRKQKAEQLRRLNSNTSEGVHVFGIGGNRSN